MYLKSAKGDLISVSFFTLKKISKKNNLSNNYSVHYPLKEKMLRIVIWHLLFGDLSQNVKLSENNLFLSELIYCPMMLNNLSF